MKDPVFYARCPCCGEKLAVDTRQRRLEALDKDRQHKPTLLDRAKDVLEEDQAKRRSSFDDAFHEETNPDKRSLDDLI